MKTLEFPLLHADEIYVRVNQVSKNGASALLYKDARVDYRILNETFGIFGWKCDYKEVKGNLYCVLSVFDEEHNQWVEKTNTGVESREDADNNQIKGEASDALKRSAFALGIGVELYTVPKLIWLNVKTVDEGKKFVLADKYQSFYVSEIGYDAKRRVNKLIICDKKTDEVVYSFGVKGVKKSQEQELKEDFKKKQEEIVDNEPTMFDPHANESEDKPISREHLSIIVGKYNSYNEDRQVRFKNWLKQEFHVATFDELTDKEAEEVITMAKMG